MNVATTKEELLSTITRELEQEYSRPIIVFLSQLTCEDLPHNNAKLAIAEFDEIKELIEPSGSVLITQPGLERKQNNIQWQELDIGNVAEKLSFMDLCLFQGVSFSDLNRYIKNQKDCSESIVNVGEQFTRITDWVAFQIVTAKTEQERNKLIKKFFLIGRLLFERHNFHGTMQIVMAFTKPAVNRLLSVEETSDVNWTKISSILQNANNFQTYRTLLSKFEDEPTCLPIFSFILSDMLHAYELFESAAQIKNKDAMAGTLEGIAKTLITFSKCQALSNPTLGDAHDPLLNLFREFENVDSEVLDVFSSLRKEWNLPCEAKKPRELKDWTPWYFASLLRINDCKNQIETIFDRGIYNGIDIINHMGKSNQRVKLFDLGINEAMVGTIISANFGNF